ncbi:MAG: exosortase system-associated protein, TIGR04073 family [Candidatus Omnitrophica bacterium]|nr:exosortase system-associated protein, TIGR04073 family [Candidatus Omnitrophota bacterium]
MKSAIVKGVLVAFVTAIIVSAAGVSYADDTLNGMGNKLRRGIVNAASGWVELPKGIYDESKAHDPATGLIWGSIKGSGLTVLRTGGGAYDTGTFLFPVPKDYKPVMEPETLF